MPPAGSSQQAVFVFKDGIFGRIGSCGSVGIPAQSHHRIVKSIKPSSTGLRIGVGLSLALLPVRCLLAATEIQSLDEFSLVSGPQNQLGSFNIVLNAGSGLSGNSAALAAFSRAANHWVSYFSDPITITIDANLASLGSGIIGSTGSVLLQASFDTIRNAMVTDAADETGNGIVGFLPTAAQFSTLLPSGFSYNGNILATKANLKALGFVGLDTTFGSSDASITFNSGFSFDYDNTDGVGAGLVDFETVATHEIGHALGFVSRVDAIDGIASGTVGVSTLDLFRFDSTSGNDPSTSAEFTSKPRDLRPAGSPVFDDISGTEYPFSTGLTQGDGRQASHWKDNLGLGVMDPTLATQEIEAISLLDLRAFDLIGYDLAPVPEPSTWAGIIAISVLGAFEWGRRRRASRQG